MLCPAFTQGTALAADSATTCIQAFTGHDPKAYSISGWPLSQLLEPDAHFGGSCMCVSQLFALSPLLDACPRYAAISARAQHTARRVCCAACLYLYICVHDSFRGWVLSCWPSHPSMQQQLPLLLASQHVVLSSPLMLFASIRDLQQLFKSCKPSCGAAVTGLSCAWGTC
jgi:hypothetical protein